MSAGRPPNYYAILDIPETATASQIRDAYKRAALKTHPDRVPSDSPERPERTRKFQLVNDAYYTLSNPTRRREYDAQRRKFPSSSFRPTPNTGAAEDAGTGTYQSPFDAFTPDSTGTGGTTPNDANNFASWAWNFFSGGAGAKENASPGAREAQEEAQFADVFEEMLREEGMAEPGTGQPTGKFWSVLGGLSGAALGFIVGNVPGLVAGVVAGNRLGAVRDARGKSVYAVFQELPQSDRARLLTQLAAKVFSHTVGI